jgi:uncharacterized damage-inducible protein DinB
MRGAEAESAGQSPMVTRHLLVVLDQAYNRRSWHGTNLRGSIRGLSAAQATWRPGRGRHNIWELVVHAAYWKYAVRRRLTGEGRGTFALKGSNWFTRPASRHRSQWPEEWRADIALLDQEHRKLRDAVSTIAERSLDARTGRRNDRTLFLIAGVAAHDLYHAGQIQLIKALSRR